MVRSPNFLFKMKRLFLCLLLPLAPLFAGEIVFQNGLDGYNEAVDTTLAGTNDRAKMANYGGDPVLRVGGVAVGGLRQLGLIRFDGLTEPGRIPPGAKIVSAWLELHKVDEPKDSGQYDRVPVANRVVAAHPMLRSWSAGQERGKPSAEGATFTTRGSTGGLEEFWGEAQQMEDGPVKEVDYDPAIAARAALTPGSGNIWMRWNLTALVQGWVANPDTNHGVLLTARSFYVGSYFASCEAESAELRPKLVVEYQ